MAVSDVSLTPSDATEPSSISSNLLLQVRARDPDGWRRLVKLYGPVVYRWCRQAGFQAEDAADIVQDVFGAVLYGISQFRRDTPQHTFRGWLWTITVNKIRDHHRKRAMRPQAAGGSEARARIEQLPEFFSSLSETESTRDDTHLVRRALELVRDEFSEQTWQAFWRATIEGHSAAEIAADLGMSNGAVRQAKYRVLMRLRRELDPPQ